MKKRILLSLGFVVVVATLFIVQEYNKGFDSKVFGDGKTIIGILPFENFPQEEMDSVKAGIEKFYKKEVRILEKVDLPKSAYTEIRYPRYRADTLLNWVSDLRYPEIDIILALTTKDISLTKYTDATKSKIKEPEWKYKDFGIFGVAYIGGTGCVVSSNRLSAGVSKATYIRRLVRISAHEVGHVLGLPHCPNKRCLMNDANESIKTIDNSTGDLCDECWKKIE